jgi:membrane protease subunit (stomatin/prohibitin family)
LPRPENTVRGGNTDASRDVIADGSKINVPEGFSLILMQDSAITGFAPEPGAFEWNSQAPDSQWVFSGQGLVDPLLRTSWERLKFGGRPQSQQRAFFVSLKELANHRSAPQSEIYWDDAYLNAQVALSLVLAALTTVHAPVGDVAKDQVQALRHA